MAENAADEVIRFVVEHSVAKGDEPIKPRVQRARASGTLGNEDESGSLAEGEQPAGIIRPLQGRVDLAVTPRVPFAPLIPP